jgi:succinate dehydrogenase / fumarate reductase, cytochrome b subunit
MNWFTKFLSSTLGRKLIMALTGLFLILFLVIHLAGNLQLMKSDGGRAFNEYAQFMATFGPIQFISKVNYALILVHVIWSIWLGVQNRKARGEQSYAITNSASTWSSRNMGILGTLILLFLVFHLQGFWWRMHNGPINPVDYDGKTINNLYEVVDTAYGMGWYVGIYVISMAVLGFHLWHGFASAFQTLGLNHLKYNPFITFVGKTFAIVVPLLFAIIPVYMYFN